MVLVLLVKCRSRARMSVAARLRDGCCAQYFVGCVVSCAVGMVGDAGDDDRGCVRG